MLNSRITVNGRQAKTVAETPERLTRASLVDGYTVRSAAINKTVANTMAPVLEDSYCPTSHMVFWNLKHMKLYSHSDRNFPGKFVDFEKPINQDAMVSHIYWAGQLVCSEPRKMAALTAITS